MFVTLKGVPRAMSALMATKKSSEPYAQHPRRPSDYLRPCLSSSHVAHGLRLQETTPERLPSFAVLINLQKRSVYGGLIIGIQHVVPIAFRLLSRFFFLLNTRKPYFGGTTVFGISRVTISAVSFY